MDNRNNTDKNEEQNEKLTITAKRIFESLSAKVVKCSKRTIKTTSDGSNINGKQSQNSRTM